MIELHRKGFFKKGDVLVLTLTGHGLKDPDTGIRVSQKPILFPSKKEEVLKYLNVRGQIHTSHSSFGSSEQPL